MGEETGFTIFGQGRAFLIDDRLQQELMESAKAIFGPVSSELTIPRLHELIEANASFRTAADRELGEWAEELGGVLPANRIELPDSFRPRSAALPADNTDHL